MKPERSLVLIGVSSDVPRAISHSPPSPAIVYYALTPEAMWALQHQGISHIIASDLDPDGRAELIRQDVFRQVVTFGRRADDIVRGYWREEPFVPPFESSAYRLLRLFGGPRLHLYFLGRAIEVSGCERVVFFTQGDHLVPGESFLTFANEGSLETALLRFGGWPDVERVDLVDTAVATVDHGRLKPRHLGGLLTRIRTTFRAMIRTAGARVPRARDGGLGRVACWGHLPYEYQAGFNGSGYVLEPYPEVGRWWEVPVEWPVDACRHSVREELRRSGLGRWEGFDWSAFLLPLVEHIVATAPNLTRLAREAEQSCRRRRIVAGISAGFSMAAHQAIAVGFRRAGVPLILWQHGMNIPEVYFPQFDYLSADYMLTYGDGASRTFKRGHPLDFRAVREPVIIPVGMPQKNARRSAELPHEVREFAGRTRGKKRIVYATTHYHRRMWIGMKPFWTDTELYRAQGLICTGLDGLVSRSLCNVILKLHPAQVKNGEFPDVEEWRHRPGWLVVKNECTFPETLEMCDAVLLDYPMTALLEAVLTPKPVFVLTRFLALEVEAQRLLRHRAALYEDPGGLVAGTEAYLSKEEYPADPRDERFAREYVDPYLDGRAGRRAADVLHGVIRKTEVR